MNIRKSMIAAALVLAATGSARAEFSSLAYVNQLDGLRTASMSMQDIFAPVLQVANSIPTLTSGRGNLALVWQDGRFNNATIDQVGSRNVGLIRQIGIGNTASIEQVGVGHRALVMQQGRGNVAIIRQR